MANEKIINHRRKKTHNNGVSIMCNVWVYNILLFIIANHAAHT